ncbi:MAG TPA: ChaN family lipoprotein [Casimicrobiaceae bacterium]|nr:ChaN family lipoprotein [Casimicrobiaceae bacterium]
MTTLIASSIALIGLAVAMSSSPEAAPAQNAASPVRIEATAAALAQAMANRRVVLLGEVHDNAAQHALRIAALKRLVASGRRPALAFEQFDRERQHDIDRARRERPRDPDYLIATAGDDTGWDWNFYRPYVKLALDHNLPIVAANLSRRDAMRVAGEGWPAVFDAVSIRELGLATLPAELRQEQERAIAIGHCNLLPPDALLPRVRAQTARDIVMARAIAGYGARGVVLLAGNGHVRRDIGVPAWLAPEERRHAVSIGLLEAGDGATVPPAGRFDFFAVTEAEQRDDPCKALARRNAPDAVR